MAKINKYYHRLETNFLFTEIEQRTKKFQEKHPGTIVHKLGIGNTTEPLPESIVKGLRIGVDKLSHVDTYTGYGSELGDSRLRKKIADWYCDANMVFDPQEVFISEGAKTELANIQALFSRDSTIAVQDPVYPVYVDSNVIAGRTGFFNNGKYKGIVYLPCNKENNFIPPLPEQKVDLIYLCSPHNPTGAVMSKKDLKRFVDYAIKHKSVIIFDAAYVAFIQDPELPRSIYEIPGAKRCTIEINSFSKCAGFAGIRLGWTIIPKDLQVEDAARGEINTMWKRRQATLFNGVSNIVQEGGLALLTKRGRKDCRKLVSYYMENARLIKKALVVLGFEAYGGENAPYIWIKTPHGMDSWEFFDLLLEKAHVVGTPGAGFGPHGEGYFRLSAFGHRQDIKKAVGSMQKHLNALK